MPIYRLIDLPIFPPPEEFDESGIVAVEGDLSPKRLLVAYRSGIFPWYSEGEPIIWWSPDPRLVLDPTQVRITRSLKKTFRRGHFEIRMDTDYASVIAACGAPRGNNPNTWLIPEMQEAYLRMYELGYGHSVETWMDGKLVGGLYGLLIGKMFFGESMFSLVPDASKVALVALCRHVYSLGVRLIDCQTHTPHLVSMGATEIPRADFLERVRLATRPPYDRSRWVWNGTVEGLGDGPELEP